MIWLFYTYFENIRKLNKHKPYKKYTHFSDQLFNAEA